MAKAKTRRVKWRGWAVHPERGQLTAFPGFGPMLFKTRGVAKLNCGKDGDKPVRVTLSIDVPAKPRVNRRSTQL